MLFVKLIAPGVVALVATTLATLVPTPAAASLLYQQPPEDGGVAWQSNSGVGLLNADTFDVDDNGQLQGISWWGTLATEGFVVRLLDSLLGSVTPLLEYSGAVNSEPTSPLIHDAAQSPIYRYWIDGLSINLTGGTTYVLYVDNEAEEWYWQTSGVGDGVSYFRGDDTQNWRQGDLDLALAIDGQRASIGHVPEPGMLTLLGLAGVAAALSRRRKTCV